MDEEGQLALRKRISDFFGFEYAALFGRARIRAAAMRRALDQERDDDRNQ
jgi:hypothetical protein